MGEDLNETKPVVCDKCGKTVPYNEAVQLTLVVITFGIHGVWDKKTWCKICWPDIQKEFHFGIKMIPRRR